MYNNVYCDFSYLAGILDHQNYDVLKQWLEYLFNNNEVKAGYKFSNKIVYGSDFHVLMYEKGYKDFLKSFIKVFDSSQLRLYRDKFFVKNAIDFLNLKGDYGYLSRLHSNEVLSQLGIGYLNNLVKKVNPEKEVS